MNGRTQQRSLTSEACPRRVGPSSYEGSFAWRVPGGWAFFSFGTVKCVASASRNSYQRPPERNHDGKRCR